MESASSCKAMGSNSRRGWFGLTEILLSSISLIEEEPDVLTSSLDISASSPRPNANFSVLPYLFFMFQADTGNSRTFPGYGSLCTGDSLYGFYLFLLIISLAKARWFLAPVDSASYKMAGIPWLGASLSFTFRWMMVLNTSSWKCRFTSS